MQKIHHSPITAQVLKIILMFGVLSYSNLLLAAGFYLQELGTPSSIGTAGTAITRLLLT